MAASYPKAPDKSLTARFIPFFVSEALMVASMITLTTQDLSPFWECMVVLVACLAFYLAVRSLYIIVRRYRQRNAEKHKLQTKGLLNDD